MICGDFNVNARTHSYPIHFLDEVPEIKVRFENLIKFWKEILNSFSSKEKIAEINPQNFSEYDILKYILSGGNYENFVDCLKVIKKFILKNKS